MKKHIRIIHPIVGAEHDESDLSQLQSDDLELSAVYLDNGPSTLASSFEVALAVPDTCARAIEAEKEGVDAIVIACMGDVGCYQARACVSIPVLGPYETSLHIASLLSTKFGVVTMVDEVVGLMENVAMGYSMAGKLGSIRSIRMSVEEMIADRDQRNRKLVEVSCQLVKEDRADAIILGCSEMQGAETFVANSLREQGINVPIIEPIAATVAVASALVDAQLTHSKQSFPSPDIGPIVGYDALRDLLEK